MKTIKMLSSGKVFEVANNEAHRLIDQGVAVLVRGKNKMLEAVSSEKKGYKIK